MPGERDFPILVSITLAWTQDVAWRESVGVLANPVPEPPWFPRLPRRVDQDPVVQLHHLAAGGHGTSRGHRRPCGAGPPPGRVPGPRPGPRAASRPPEAACVTFVLILAREDADCVMRVPLFLRLCR
jgi:hypothetical protein